MTFKLYELAQELGVPASDLTKKAKQLKIGNLNFGTTLSEDEEQSLRESFENTLTGGVLKKSLPNKTNAKKSESSVDSPKTSTTKVSKATKSSKTKKEAKSKESISSDELESLSQKGLLKKKDSTKEKAAIVNSKAHKQTELATETLDEAEKTKIEPAKPLQKKSTALIKSYVPPVQAIKFIRKVSRKDPVTENTDDKTPEKEAVPDNSKNYHGGKKFKSSAKNSTSHNYKFQGKRSSHFKPIKKAEPKLSTIQRKKDIIIPKILTVAELSNLTGIKAAEIIKILIDLGMLATINQSINSDTAQLICNEFKIDVKVTDFNPESLLVEENTTTNTVKRPPVVTIMGHVDHGKTSLLDKIRRTSIALKEAGGITQHIGAYFVKTKEGDITFLDTPGHEAFTSMRARGANATDIVILVVAADDGPNTQTVEAINHAKAANVPILVAINKCDKPGADPEKTKQRLMEAGLIAESFGGNTTMVNVSAKTGEGIGELLSLVVTQAETMDLKADLNTRARGVVIESRLDKIRGNTMSILVQEGILKSGDTVLAGTSIGKIKAIFNFDGAKIDKVHPSYPAEILGMNNLPLSGDTFVITDSEKTAKIVKQYRTEKNQAEALKANSKIRMEDLFSKLQSESTITLNLILKTDVQGSLEAIQTSLGRWESDKINLRYLHASVGAITSSDVALASASNAIVIGFNVRPDQNAKTLSDKENVQIKIYNVIYDIFEDVKKSLEGMMDPVIHEEELGKAEVTNVFTVTKVGVVAGCKVTEGKVTSIAKARIIRDNIVLYSGKIKSLKRFKDTTKEVFSGFECGVVLDNYKDIKVGDSLEFYLETKEAPLLT